jgi:hypothetical protein
MCVYNELSKTWVSWCCQNVFRLKSLHRFLLQHFIFFIFYFCCSMQAMASSIMKFLDHTQWHIILGRTSLEEWSARRRELYVSAHNNHKRQTFMLPTVFEITILAGERTGAENVILVNIGEYTVQKNYVFKHWRVHKFILPIFIIFIY